MMLCLLLARQQENGPVTSRVYNSDKRNLALAFRCLILTNSKKATASTCFLATLDPDNGHPSTAAQEQRIV